MSHLSRIRLDLENGANPWLLGKPVTQAEFQAFDDAQFESINGDEGGDWAPSSQIVIGNQGVLFSGPAQIEDCTVFTVGADSQLTFAEGSTTALVGHLTFGAGSNWFLDGELDIENAGEILVDVGSTITVNGSSTWTLNGQIASSGSGTTYGATTTVTSSTLTFVAGSIFALSSGSFLSAAPGATITHSGATTYSATATLSQGCAETVSGSGATTAWRIGTAPTSSTSFDCSHDIYAGASPGSSVVHTLLDATATVPPKPGSIVRFVIAAGGAHAVTWQREDGSVVAFVNSTSLNGARASFIYRDGGWHTRTWFDF